jgi:hypothetical protein
MEPKDLHISRPRLQAFAEGTGELDPTELYHFARCNQCGRFWWECRTKAILKLQENNDKRTA